MLTKPNPTFSPNRISKNHCFICGQELTSENRTKEHTFPRWLQKKFNLFDSRIILPNQTTIQYHKHVVPCCKPCNNETLSKIEKNFLSYIKNPEVTTPTTLFNISIWLIKINLALTYKSTLLKSTQRSDLETNNIYPKEFLDQIEIGRQLILASQHEKEFPYGINTSIITYQTNHSKSHFHFKEDTETSTINIQIGNIGILASLHDSGIIYHHIKTIPNALNIHTDQDASTRYEIFKILKKALWERGVTPHIFINPKANKNEILTVIHSKHHNNYFQFKTEDPSKEVGTPVRYIKYETKDLFGIKAIQKITSLLKDNPL